MKGKTIKTTLIAVAMILILIMSVLLLTRTGRHISTGGLNVMEDKEFGNTYIGLSIDQFNDLGFSFGDSVDIFFDNGMKFRDVPYYSGYYTPVGGFLLCGYPGYPHPMVTFNYGDPTWLDFGISKDTEVVVVLNEKGKYRATEDLNALHYSDKEAITIRLTGANTSRMRYLQTSAKSVEETLRTKQSTAPLLLATTSITAQLTQTGLRRKTG